MAGLLDITEDPQTMGLLSLGLRLMSTPGKFGAALGQSGMGALGDLQQMQQRKKQGEMQALQRQMLEAQLQGAKRAQEKEAAIDNAYMGALSSPGQVPDQAALIRGLSTADPRAAYQMLQPKPDELMTLTPGQTIINKRDPTKPVFTAPDKPEKAPEAWQLYQLSGAAGKGVPFDEWNRANKRSGATNVGLSVNTEKPFMNELATGLGKQIDNSLGAARAATTAVSTAHRLKSAIDTGKVVAGPGASFRVLGLQIGQMLGVGGKDGAEVLANTRTAIQSMAQAELDAAQQMKGQGQITEAERDIIRRAASGNVDTMTAPEIRLLADAMEKTARAKIATHRKNVDSLSKMPNAAALMPFYQVDEPGAYQVPGVSAEDLVKKYGRKP